MAKQVLTKLIDDLDGSEAAETVTFALDGRTYEIDLSTKNANKLRHTLASYVERGERISAGQRPASRPKVEAPAGRDQNRAIREWAQRKGYEVAPRGRIKREVVERYENWAGVR